MVDLDRERYAALYGPTVGDQVMPDVVDMLTEVQVEATFPDGRKLVTIHQPIA